MDTITDYKAISELPEGYEPSEKEEYMCRKHLAFFFQKLDAEKKLILESEQKIRSEVTSISSEKNIETIDVAGAELKINQDTRINRRSRNRLAIIEELLSSILHDNKLIDSGNDDPNKRKYGYCIDSGLPIGLKRLKVKCDARRTIEAQQEHELQERMHNDITISGPLHYEY